MSMDAAIEMGALAMFGEKYGERVRVCWFDDVSIELCGGTHLARTGDIGLFTFVSEGSVSAGVRRVEAVTGNAALARLQQGRRQLQELGALLKVKPDKIGERVQGLLEEQKAFQRKEAERAGAAAADAAKNLASKATELGGHKVLVADAGELDGGQLRKAADAARADGVEAIFLASQAKGKAALLAASTLEAVHAGNWVKECAPAVKGGGGGKPDMAQAGGKDPSGIPQALAKATAFLQAALS
jgi:alanyl-tRNA synthetase